MTALRYADAMTAPTPAQVRARRARVRALGKGLVALALVALGVAAVVLLIDLSVIGVPGTVLIACGAMVAPIAQVGAGAAICADALGQYAVIGFGLLAVALVAGIAGAVVWVRARD